MGILDFFRKKKVQEPEPEPEKITFTEVENWLNKKENQNREKEKEVLNQINEKITLFVNELQPKLDVLKEIDIEAKKVEDRAKIIVRQSLNKYLDYVKIFIKKLKELVEQNPNLTKFFKEVNKIFSEFEKHSYIFYQRSTYLVGDELVSAKQEMVNLSEYFTKLFKENKKTIDSQEKISSTKLKLKQLDETKTTIKEINTKAKSLNENLNRYEKKKDELLEEIEKIKASDDYQQTLKNEEEIINKEKEREQDIQKLKESIDFKSLTNFFHSNEGQMKLVKDFKEDFKTNFQKKNGEDILDLLKEANMNSGIVGDKIESINLKKEEIMKMKGEIVDDEVESLSEEIRKVKKEIENSNIEKVKLLKRLENNKEKKEEIIESIKKEVEEIGAIVI